MIYTIIGAIFSSIFWVILFITNSDKFVDLYNKKLNKYKCYQCNKPATKRTNLCSDCFVKNLKKELEKGGELCV